MLKPRLPPAQIDNPITFFHKYSNSKIRYSDGFLSLYFFILRTIFMISAKAHTRRRIIAIMLIFSIFATYLLFSVFRLSYFMYDYYNDKAYDQVTTSSKLIANRGYIYDSNMNVLAASSTLWRVSVSPRDIRLKSEETGLDYARMISLGLAPILNLDTNEVYKKITNSRVLDVTLKKSVNDNVYSCALNFIQSNKLESLVQFEAKTSRYYPAGTLAAHVLGFTGSDSQGLYGLEYYYDETLRGIDGYYVYAKDANGNQLDTEYSTYIPAEDGHSLVTTIDSFVQAELEAIIENARTTHGAENRVTGIVMNTKTGAVLAMATTSPFNPNSPFELSEFYQGKLDQSGYIAGSDEYKALKNDLMQVMWSNKAVSELYEPGSTFKIITVASAIDCGAVKMSDTFSCNGYHVIGGWRIRCHKAGGHGSGFNLAYGLQMSCNPCMMSVSERMGSSTFYSYVKSFGLLEKTGIDLPSEAKGIFHSEEAIGPTELATSSFGQRFKVTPINLLTAISTVANDGVSVTPYVVERIIDSEGNTVSSHKMNDESSVISPEVARSVTQALIDGVNGDGGAKNAGVIGYDIAAKTGTSQKFDILDANGNSYLRIGSTVAYSCDSDMGIAAIIIVDEPTSQVKYGSVVAAPYISKLMESVLPYLEFKRNSTEMNIAAENYTGIKVDDAKKKLESVGIEYEIIGDGKIVYRQTPEAGQIFTFPLSKVILYTEEDCDAYSKVPEIRGLTLENAIKLLISSGLNINIRGNGAISPDSNDLIIEQSIPPAELVPRGTVIEIRAITTEYED